MYWCHHLAVWLLDEWLWTAVKNYMGNPQIIADTTDQIHTYEITSIEMNVTKLDEQDPTFGPVQMGILASA